MSISYNKNSIALVLLFIIENYSSLVFSMEPIHSAINLIDSYGYPTELHFVITKDGYNLTVHRIPYGKNITEGNSSQRIPVLLLHGLFGASDNYIILGPDKSVAFLLADQGYDVWLGNSRGNTHSRQHIKLDPDKDRAFWRFSWHEVGVIDIPDMIDYILHNTGYKKLHYIGHSQGTTAMFVMLSERPEYNKKIISYSAYAPSAFLKHVANPILMIAANFYEILQVLADLLQFDELLLPGSNVYLQGLLRNLCGMSDILKELCAIILAFGNGFSTELLDKDMLPTLANMAPAGGSTRQALHYAMLIKSGLFIKYDYGTGNMAKYGRRTPPKYTLNKIFAPTGFFYGPADMLCTPTDVEALGRVLKSVKLMYRVPHPNFGHLDFLIANRGKSLLYDAAIDFMKKMERNTRTPIK